MAAFCGEIHSNAINRNQWICPQGEEELYSVSEGSTLVDADMQILATDPWPLRERRERQSEMEDAIVGYQLAGCHHPFL